MNEGRWESDHSKHSCHQLIERKPIPRCFRTSTLLLLLGKGRSRKWLPDFTDVAPGLIGRVENHRVLFWAVTDIH